MLRSLVTLAAIASIGVGSLTAQSATFTRRQLSPNYYAEGANAGDFNRDGRMDVVAGPFWWAGPDFAVRHAIYSPQTFPINGYADNFLAFAFDVDADGWDDVMTIGFPGTPAYWYENPRTTGTLWAKHLVHATIDGESPAVAQLIPGGLPEIVCGTGGQLGYLTPDPVPTKPWVFRAISAVGPWTTFHHGLGVGDVNGDGRMDVLTKLGWFEQPASGTGLWPAQLFTFTPAGGAQMFAYDIDGDQDNDVVSSIAAHGYGLSWFEHQRAGNTITFAERVILPKTPPPGPPVQFSQLHALDRADIDGDGLDDIVTGKTFWAHNGNDPGANDPAVLYWFQPQRVGTVTTFVPHLVDSDSGVGRQVIARDMNRDGRRDILVGNKKGVFVFLQDTLATDVAQISVAQGGKQSLTLNAGAAHAGKAYWLFGSMSGAAPGINVTGVHVPLNPDSYTYLVVALTNGPLFARFQGTLDGQGIATATVDVPSGLTGLIGVTLRHASIVQDALGNLAFASNAAPLQLMR